MTDAGPLQLVDHDEEDEEERELLPVGWAELGWAGVGCHRAVVAGVGWLYYECWPQAWYDVAQLGHVDRRV
jgi:hypothetical protein